MSNHKDTQDFFEEAAWLWLHTDSWYGQSNIITHLIKFAVTFAAWFVRHTEGIGDTED